MPALFATWPHFDISAPMIAYGKANPGKLSFASSGNGGAPHFSGELFKSMTNIEMTHVPYKGSTLAHRSWRPGRCRRCRSHLRGCR